MATRKAKNKRAEHTKVYYAALGYDIEDPTEYVPSEIIEPGEPEPRKAQDIHHIFGRENRIENLIALTREQHVKYGDKKQYYYFLLTTHYDFLIEHGVEFDYEYMEALMLKYADL